MARVYATEADYQEWTGDQSATASPSLLARASLLVDRALIGAVYPTDTTGLPTETDHIDALRDAVCAQLQWWDELGDTTGQGAASQFASASIGTAHYQRGGRDGGGSDGKSLPDRLGPTVLDVLHVASLLPTNACISG